MDTNIDYSSWGYYTAYVLYDNTQDNNYYLPLTFGVNYNGWWGQQPQTVRQPSFEGGSKFEYELLPDPAHDCYQLHVYGDTIWSNSPNRYAYCVVEKSSSVYKVSIKYEELEPCIDGIGRYHVDLYFPFFLAEHHYVTVDNYGEHPVVVRQDIPTDYRPFIEEGKVWKVGRCPAGGTHATELAYYYFEGDTIIDGRECKKMSRRHEKKEASPWTEYVGAWYEDERRVYCIFPNTDELMLLYDFGSEQGATIVIYNGEASYLQAKTMATILELNDHYYEFFKGCVTTITIPPLDLNGGHEDSSNIWMEGVGSPTSPLVNVLYSDWSGNYDSLISCTVGDEVLYYNHNLIDGVTPDPSEVKKNTIDFTHTVKTRPKAPRRGAVNETGGDEPLTGEYSLKELFVNFKPLSGPYVITICDDSGTEVYRKEVQTSNVIGLNTDISGYSKGEYIITVENNEEAYTANFCIDDAVGINRPTPDPSLYGGEKAGANKSPFGGLRGAFDLSGRKVGLTPNPSPVGEGRAGLPRGVYIKDGRKVVVR